MFRCTRRSGLAVHHKRRDGGNGIDNAEVLCQKCHEATKTYGMPGKPPAPFSPITKLQAKIRADGQCECTRVGGCH